MKKFVEVVPAAGFGLILIVLAVLELLGSDFLGLWIQTAVGAISLISGLLILSLCITGPLIWGVLYLVRRTRYKER
ncbi:MAG: hypothetical protein KME20_27825 [Kaiparowitsia implicata GSE-PSE-MK54-09C]|jgi:formate/nitrite transporter FocA (FNT family)|nr:hypothetical protein [Kaiparowitsia implicata GSE-PSE-MK54-09C]